MRSLLAPQHAHHVVLRSDVALLTKVPASAVPVGLLRVWIMPPTHSVPSCSLDRAPGVKPARISGLVPAPEPFGDERIRCIGGRVASEDCLGTDALRCPLGGRPRLPLTGSALTAISCFPTLDLRALRGGKRRLRSSLIFRRMNPPSRNTIPHPQHGSAR
jgi:hypothetical protein